MSAVRHIGHKCRHSAPGKVCAWCFLQSIAFPVEHFVWERLPGLSWITAHVLS